MSTPTATPDARDVPLELPPKPRRPDLDECCGNGCDPCVFDRYHDALAAWERACREIEAKAKATATSVPTPGRSHRASERDA